MNKATRHRNPTEDTHERGVALIIVILVMSFLLIIGLVLVTVTTTGTRVAGNVRGQQLAFNAAEAGFDATWKSIQNSFLNDLWTTFDGHYLTEPIGVDDPLANEYFRKLTDLELLNYIDPNEDGIADVGNVIFCRERYVLDTSGALDPRYTYTCFLIDDEAAGALPDAGDVLLICIGTHGTGNTMSTTRLEIELVIELAGT
ncbi:PilX N-terminal domain-containing pilus assembly protein [Acidobacteriota bacterium]